MLETITKLLESVDSQETFCTSERIPTQNFKVHVKGVGSIPFPVSEKTAKALIKESRLASFGWRDQTVVDTRVRNVWEVPKNKIQISQTSFEKTITPVLEKIKQGLGLDPKGELSAELHNLVVYEKGQFFSSHQDTEKNEGMVATMVVLLPSDFKGGTLTIDQHGDKKHFRALKKGEDRLTVIAFYADCQHEVKKITSGYRIALTYNLIFQASQEPQPTSVSNPLLVKAIRDYFGVVPKDENFEDDFSERRHPQWLVYLFDHQYSQKGLSWSQLKGQDRSRAEQLCAAADTLGLEVHLTLADIHEVWQAEEEYDGGGWYQDDWEEESSDGESVNLVDLIDETYSLVHWIDRQGKKVSFQGHSVPKEMFCWNKANNELKPFESQYEGYMGNYGNTMDYWYHRAAVVLWPKDQEYANQFAIDPVKTLKNIRKVLEKDAKRGAQCLRQVLPQWNRLRFLDAAESAELFEIAILVQDKELAFRLLSHLSLEAVCPKNVKRLVALFESYGEAWVLQLLEKFSKSKRYDSQYLSDVSAVVEDLSSCPGVIAWLLTHQLSTLARDDKDKNERSLRIDLQREEKKQEARLLDLLKALCQEKEVRLFEEAVDHVLKQNRVYPNIMLARAIAQLDQLSGLNGVGKRFVAEVADRLRSDLSNERKPGDFSISEPVPCRCADCKELALFLGDKERQTFSWPLAKPRRQHIHQTIDGMGIGVTHQTIRKGSPFQLILTKTDAHFKKEATTRLEAQKCLKDLMSLREI